MGNKNDSMYVQANRIVVKDGENVLGDVTNQLENVFGVGSTIKYRNSCRRGEGSHRRGEGSRGGKSENHSDRESGVDGDCSRKYEERISQLESEVVQLKQLMQQSHQISRQEFNVLGQMPNENSSRVHSRSIYATSAESLETSRTESLYARSDYEESNIIVRRREVEQEEEEVSAFEGGEVSYVQDSRSRLARAYFETENETIHEH